MFLLPDAKYLHDKLLQQFIKRKRSFKSFSSLFLSSFYYLFIPNKLICLHERWKNLVEYERNFIFFRVEKIRLGWGDIST